MLKLIEKLLIKLSGNTSGYDFNMFDWDIMSLFDHYYHAAKLTKAVQHALAFLEEVGRTMERWHPTEKRHKPYGRILNETRKLR